MDVCAVLGVGMTLLIVVGIKVVEKWTSYAGTPTPGLVFVDL
jgi:purine-cytosine permease-like protein